MAKSRRRLQFELFAEKVGKHIDDYTVPQYGDEGEDLCTDYTAEHCFKQVEKYLKRRGKNSRPGQDQLDIIKMVHYLQMASSKLASEAERMAKEEP